LSQKGLGVSSSTILSKFLSFIKLDLSVLNHRLTQPSIGQMGKEKLRSGSLFKTIFEKEGGKIVTDLKIMNIIQRQ